MLGGISECATSKGTKHKPVLAVVVCNSQNRANETKSRWYKLVWNSCHAIHIPSDIIAATATKFTCQGFSNNA